MFLKIQKYFSMNILNFFFFFYQQYFLSNYLSVERNHTGTKSNYSLIKHYTNPSISSRLDLPRPVWTDSSSITKYSILNIFIVIILTFK